ncbi:MAG TPA: hypothetical protein PKC43_13970 [Phycisphaerales bacterium]|nr:hypothetical protein [Phycisphaerales bacterium]HMP38541.1 hypothetical protein [Phycisphaerales bacterium]
MSKRVLIHDDEQHTLEYHVRLLREDGYGVDFIEDDARAHRVMTGSDRGHALLVLDMMMPAPIGVPAIETESNNRTGRWFLREYRKACDVATPVLLYSRLGEQELLIAGWQAYEGWHFHGRGATPKPPTDEAERKQRLRDGFKVQVAAKKECDPHKFLRLVQEIIGRP